MKIIFIYALIALLSMHAMEIQDLIITKQSFIFYLSEKSSHKEQEERHHVTIPQGDLFLLCYKECNYSGSLFLPLNFIFNRSPFTYDDITREIIISSSKYRLIDNPGTKTSVIDDFKRLFKYFKHGGHISCGPGSYEHTIRHCDVQYHHFHPKHCEKSRIWLYDKAMQEAEQYEKLKCEEEEKERKRLEKLAPIATRLQTYSIMQNLQNNVEQLLVLARQ